MLQFVHKSIPRAAAIAFCLVVWPLVMVKPSAAAVDHEALLRDRLNEVRELLERRLAHREMLNEQIEALSLKLDQLHLERRAALDGLSEQVDQTRSYEIELDRLIPRLLPRLNRLETLRKQGARAITDLAKMERQGNVKAATKARFLSTKTIFIDQMRKASASVRLLRRAPNGLIGKHRDLDFQIPLLATAADRVAGRQDRLQRRRDGAIRSLADLNVDIERLTAEEHRLARNMLARTLTASRMSPNNRLDIGKAEVGDANIKSAATRSTSHRLAVTNRDDVEGRTMPSTKALSPKMPGRGLAGTVSTQEDGGWTARNVARRSSSEATFDREPRTAALQANPLSSTTSRVGRGRLHESNPLVPTRETISYSIADIVRQAGQYSIEIPATPRQRVASPEGGIIVFAGDFRSYGLLLIIEHDSEYHTLLWGFSSLDIEVGDLVQTGQIIGAVGLDHSPKLHVELRRNGEPVNPEVWLAASNSGIEG